MNGWSRNVQQVAAAGFDLIDFAIAIVVDTVTQFVCAREDIGVGVIAVIRREDTIAVGIGGGQIWIGIIAVYGSQDAITV